MKYSIPTLCVALFLSSVPTFAATMPSGENKASCPNGASVGRHQRTTPQRATATAPSRPARPAQGSRTVGNG